MTGYVYAIADDRGFVKIGWSKTPERRLAEMNVGAPIKHTLIGYIPGTKADEAEAHAKLNAWRQRGEWFRHEGSVRDFTSALPPVNRGQSSTRPVRHVMEHIRRGIFGMHQTEFAGIAGVTQGTVSRWEKGEIPPRRDHMARIRVEAIRRGLDWDDAVFFQPDRYGEAA